MQAWGKHTDNRQDWLYFQMINVVIKYLFVCISLGIFGAWKSTLFHLFAQIVFLILVKCLNLYKLYISSIYRRFWSAGLVDFHTKIQWDEYSCPCQPAHIGVSTHYFWSYILSSPAGESRCGQVTTKGQRHNMICRPQLQWRYCENKRH